MDSLLYKLGMKETWERFYAYKMSLGSNGSFEKELIRFINEEKYIPVCHAIADGKRFPLPKKAIISKMDTAKKRVVYIYPEPENTVLKILTWLLLRRYNGIFNDNLYSFRPGYSAKDAVLSLRSVPGIRQMYSYKADISNYFNSVPVEMLLPVLDEALSDDRNLFAFLKELLEEPDVLDGSGTGNTAVIREQKGIMAGTPLSAFYANLYLRDLDRHFNELGIPYARYSDDMILFAKSREEVESQAAFIRSFLTGKGLQLNSSKEEFRDPDEGWTFLGFFFHNGVTDIAPASVYKIKRKMRRKSRALYRWACRNGADPERAATAFIRVFNRKLMGDDTGRVGQPDSQDGISEHDLTWSRWFFSVINTDKSLREIDRYAQECIRYLLSGTHTKARFNIRYETLKSLGYRSLVHAYYQPDSADNVKI